MAGDGSQVFKKQNPAPQPYKDWATTIRCTTARMGFRHKLIRTWLIFAVAAQAPVERQAEPENVEPINQQPNPIVDELSQRRRRKRDQANGAEKREVNACKVPAGAGEMIELDLLADPRDVE